MMVSRKENKQIQFSSVYKVQFNIAADHGL